MDNGKTEAMSRRQATSSSLIGRVMEKQTMWALWKNAKTALSIPWRATPAMLADREAILLGAALSTVTAYLLIKQMESNALHT